MSAKPRRVTWTSDEELQCAILGSMGFSTRFIQEKTGLTPCQVSYRLNKASIKRRDYRNGESAMAQRVMERVVPARAATIRDMLELKEIK